MTLENVRAPCGTLWLANECLGTIQWEAERKHPLSGGSIGTKAAMGDTQTQNTERWYEPERARPSLCKSKLVSSVWQSRKTIQRTAIVGATRRKKRKSERKSERANEPGWKWHPFFHTGALCFVRCRGELSREQPIRKISGCGFPPATKSVVALARRRNRGERGQRKCGWENWGGSTGKIAPVIWLCWLTFFFALRCYCLSMSFTLNSHKHT